MEIRVRQQQKGVVVTGGFDLYGTKDSLLSIAQQINVQAGKIQQGWVTIVDEIPTETSFTNLQDT
jgi:ferric-dicitrate binding protein FerR (iron transport regulator)